MSMFVLLSMLACGVNGGVEPLPVDEFDPETPTSSASPYLPRGERSCAMVTTWNTVDDAGQWSRAIDTTFGFDTDRYTMMLPMTETDGATCMVGIAELDGFWRATVENPCTSPCGGGEVDINELIGRQDGDVIDFRLDFISDVCTADVRVVCDLASINSAADWPGDWFCASAHYTVDESGVNERTGTSDVGTRLADRHLEMGGCVVPMTEEPLSVLARPTTCTLDGVANTEITGAAATVVADRLTAHVQYSAGGVRGVWSHWCVPEPAE